MPDPVDTLQTDLNHWLAEVTGCESGLVVVHATVPFPLDDLLVDERAHYEAIAHPRRRHSWRLGRAALKPILATQDRAIDTANLRWPDPTVTLSHTDNRALAIGVLPSPLGRGTFRRKWVRDCSPLPLGEGVSQKRVRVLARRADVYQGHYTIKIRLAITGIGLDLEPLDRIPSARLVDHLLNPAELPAWQALTWPDEPAQAQAALRLWTVKEAVWKSYPHNATLPLNQVTIHQLEPMEGTAFFGDQSLHWQAHYKSWQWQGHWVTVAVCLAV